MLLRLGTIAFCHVNNQVKKRGMSEEVNVHSVIVGYDILSGRVLGGAERGVTF